MKSGGHGATMSRILVLMDHKENRRLLAEWLTTRYTVLPQESDEAVDEPYDLCILDGTALDRLADRIQDRKKYQQTVFLPFLLVTAAQQVGLVTRHLWKSIDEVIHSPIDKLELQARMEVLLRARRLGKGSGRTYSLTAEAQDLAGNTSAVTAACVVPHDQGKK